MVTLSVTLPCAIEQVLKATNRARTKLLALQAEAPNTFRAAHTMIAFRSTAAEFHHRLHAYQDQGFFDAKLVEEITCAHSCSPDRSSAHTPTWDRTGLGSGTHGSV